MDKRSAVRILFEEGWNQENFGPVEGVLAEEFEFHIGDTTQTMTIGDLRGIVRRWHVGFPDFKFHVHAVVASDDRAAAHATLRGTHLGPWSGLEPTSRALTVEHMFFFRFEGGRVVEVWELLDRSEVRRQLVDD